MLYLSCFRFIVFAVLGLWLFCQSQSNTFLGFCFVIDTILCLLVLRPLFKLAKLGERLSDDQVAKIIGKHFQDVSDKLLNVIQLKKNKGSLALIEAV